MLAKNINKKNFLGKITESIFLLLIFFFPYSTSIRNIIIFFLFIFFILDKIINKDFIFKNVKYKNHILIIFSFSILSGLKAENLYLWADTLISPGLKYIVFYFITYNMVKRNGYKKYFKTLFWGNLFLVITALYLDLQTSIDFFYRTNDRGDLAGFMVLFFIASFLIEEKKLYLKLLSVIGIIGGTIAFILTYSRGATLGVVACVYLLLAAFIWKKYKEKMGKKLIFGLIIGVLILSLVLTPFILPNKIVNRFKNIKNIDSSWSLKGRLLMWKSSLLMIRNNPILGIGAGNFNSNFLYYVDEVFKVDMPKSMRWHNKPHNLFLYIAAEQGIISLIIFLFLLYKSLFISWVNFKKENESSIFGFIFAGMITIIFFHSFVDTTFLYGNVGFYLIIIFVFNLYFFENKHTNEVEEFREN